MKSDHLTSFQTEDWDELALNMVSEFVIRTHPVFTCVNILQYGVVDEDKEKEEESERISKTSQKIIRMLVNMILACNQLCYLFSA